MLREFVTAGIEVEKGSKSCLFLRWLRTGRPTSAEYAERVGSRVIETRRGPRDRREQRATTTASSIRRRTAVIDSISVIVCVLPNRRPSMLSMTRSTGSRSQGFAILREAET